MSEFDFGAEYAAFGDDLKGVSFEGEYDMVVLKCTPGQTAKGKQKFTVTLGFTSGPNKQKNKTVMDQLIWSPESDVAARIFSTSLKVLGASHEWIMANRPSPQQIADKVTGTVVSVRLKPDEFNNQPTTRVSYLKTVSAKSPDNAGAAKPAAAASGQGAKSQAVKLDDADEGTTVVTPTAATDTATETPETGQEPATAGAGASSNPWA